MRFCTVFFFRCIVRTEDFSDITKEFKDCERIQLISWLNKFTHNLLLIGSSWYQKWNILITRRFVLSWKHTYYLNGNENKMHVDFDKYMQRFRLCVIILCVKIIETGTTTLKFVHKTEETECWSTLCECHDQDTRSYCRDTFWRKITDAQIQFPDSRMKTKTCVKH